MKNVLPVSRGLGRAVRIIAKIIWIVIRVIGWIVYGLWLVFSPTMMLAAEIAIMIAAITMIPDRR